MKNKHKEHFIANNKYEKFEFDKNRILIRTSFPNSEQHFMALDLGAGSTVLLQNSGLEYIRTLQPILSFGKIRSAENRHQKANYYAIGSIKTNTFGLENSFLPLVPDFQLTSCQKFTGVWGSDLFDTKILVLKMQDSTIAVFDTLPTLNDWTLVESEYKFPHFYVVLRIGTQKIKLLLDTGCSSGIVLSEDYYNQGLKGQNQLVKDYSKWYGSAFNTASGLTTADTTTTATLVNASWGSFTIDSIPLTISKKIKRNVIGMDVFKRFNILLDYSHHNVYIQKNISSNLIDNHSFLKETGFNYRNVNGITIIVSIIKMNSVAEKEGMKINDEIISVNGISLEAKDFCKIEEIFSSLDVNKSNTMVLKRGSTVLTCSL